MQLINKINNMKKNMLWGVFGFFMLFLSITAAMTGTINLSIDEAELIKFEMPISELFIANPDVADVQLSSPKAAYLFGKGIGITKLIAMDAKGAEVFKATVNVSQNLGQLRELISYYDPHELVEIKSVPGGILLEGLVDSPKIAEDIRSLASGFIKKAKDSSLVVLNRLKIKPPVQINLRVRFAEVSRNVVNMLGFDWQSVAANVGSFKFGALANRAPFTTLPIVTNDVTSITQPVTTVPGQNISSIGFGFNNTNVNINAAIDLLAQDGLVTILAEPNLTTISGETASFLAGGEFPYPVPQQFGSITIQFMQYGVSLAFTPTVLDGNLISIHVRPEVSELDALAGVSVNGTSVPGILTRRAETTVQLGSGQSFAIAGLLKNNVVSQIASLPGLGDLPILGALFRSNSFIRDDTELVILVTPFLVEPITGKEMLLPTDGMNYATFVEQIFERRILRETSAKGQAPAFGPGGVRLVGPAGFSVE